LFQDARAQNKQIMLDVLSENMAEGLIMEVLKENNIDLSENTFGFHLKVLLEKHEVYLNA
jgi:hypothetical protein